MGATQTSIALHLDLSTTRVGELVALGVIPDDADLDTARITYIRYLREIKAGRRIDPVTTSDGEVLDLTAERAKLAKAQSETAELKNAELRGELIRRDELRSAWADRVLSWKERLRAIPAAATVHVPGFSAAMGRALATLIDETLTELADGVGGSGNGNGVRVKRTRRRAGASAPAA